MVYILYVKNVEKNRKEKNYLATTEKRECPKCHRTLKLVNFYRTNDIEKYPDGFIPECKKCLTQLVDNWRPSSFLHILQKADVPYIPKEWNTLLAKYADNPSKVTGSTVLGRYLSKMKLNNYSQFRFSDTPKFVSNEQEQREAFAKQVRAAALHIETLEGRDASVEIKKLERAITGKSLIEIEEEQEKQIKNGDSQEDGFWSRIDFEDVENAKSFKQQKEEERERLLKEADMPMGYALSNDNVLDYSEELTVEEQRALIFKWGKSYSLEDLVRMETLYQETAESFDVTNPSHKDYLKKACKASLHLDKSLDYGDAEGATKYGRLFDLLNKSAQFTAATNKFDKDEYIGSVGELVAICEKEGFIPRYINEENPDIVDKTIKDMNNYIHKLISNEMNLSDLIESSIKMIAIEEARAKQINVEDVDYDGDWIIEDEIEDEEE